MLRYKYNPLLEGHIRLLTLHPGDLDDPINKARIDHMRLDEKPTFGALSYQWGAKQLNHKVEVTESGESGGTSDYVNITLSLYNALLHIRRKDEPISIWADAICIN
ncbi:Heterokaryon incompatibility [Penicillium expansum]|uniref:Heterokaryon incompatibility n=1 Tax=Penicillium expansum TaxID=27334 RepID=A0A0A2J6G5_PENEN|nr:Heterokaryon incompatibility [Penicillium expansum]KGO42598.1 Heterokaryon incompatibility [Penicillium expansum]KGO50351.1 Heterokaryon incompatibility [Penicillium expansum]KGO67313.1 Heterokaryon incompatibility [Penicillium expansum]